MSEFELDDLKEAVRDVEKAVEEVGHDVTAFSLDSLELAVKNVEKAVNTVGHEVNRKWSSIQYGVAGLIVFWVLSLPGNIWYSQWRYETFYDLSSDKVVVATEPHDCNFLAAPLGEKYCHYDRIVSTVRWATSVAGNPIASYDEGKTWSTFTPDPGVTVPKFDTVQSVYVTWEKKSD